jgi:DNA invertase Pin-like site-specific DNA recombinase
MRENSQVSRPLRAALYARVSTHEQTPENQLLALRAFASARGWTLAEYVDHGISGAKDRRPQLDAMLAAVRKRKVDLVLVTKLDRLARSVHHLVSLGREFSALGVDLVALDQQVDTTTPAGRLLFNVLASIAEFERDLIRDRVVAGIRRAQARGQALGRPRLHEVDAARAKELLAQGLSLRAVGRALGIHHFLVRRALQERSASGALVSA